MQSSLNTERNGEQRSRINREQIAEGNYPSAPELERETLHGLLTDNDARIFLAWLEPLDFFDPWNCCLFTELQLAQREGVPFTPGALTERLTRRDHLTQMMKLMGVKTIDDARREFIDQIGILIESYTPGHLRYHAERLRAIRRKRASAILADKLVELSNDPALEVEVFVKRALTMIARISTIPSVVVDSERYFKSERRKTDR